MKKKHRKKIENEYDSQFEDYRNNIRGERTKYINVKLSKLSILGKITELDLDDIMTDFDVTSLNSSAMYDEKSVYPDIENVFASKPHMNDNYVEEFILQTFNQDGDESASLKTKYYNPPNLTFQHLPVEKKSKP